MSPPFLFGLSMKQYAKLTAGVTAGSSYVLAIGTSQLAWLPWAFLWAGFYLLSALAATLLLVRFPSPFVTAFAGAATIVAHFMRGSVLVYGWLFGLAGVREFSAWQIIVGVTAWWLLAFAVAMLFFTRLAVLASAERVREV